MEAYRSGHNGPDSKSGIRQRIVGSNPTASAKKKRTPFRVCSIEIFLLWEVVRLKAVPLPFRFKRFAGLLLRRYRIFLLFAFFSHQTFPLGVRQPYQ